MSGSQWTEVLQDMLFLRPARHVISEGMFPRVKLERNTAPQRFAATNGERTRDLCEKTIPLKTNGGFTEAKHSGVSYHKIV